MSEAVTLVGYAVVVAAMAALEARARRRPNGPTAGRVLGVLLRSPVAQLAAGAAWLWVGWHLFVRASR
jgi:Family of unknown function (DUF6186)